MKVKVNRAKLDGLNPEQRREAEKLLSDLDELQQQNPLAFFHPHSAPQREFLEARTAIVAAFAGNRFGKTTILMIRALIECLPKELLPTHLQGYKRFDAPCSGWIVCPSEDKVFDSLLPALRKWAPQGAFTRGLDKAWNGQRMQLTFACGSQITFKTYKQDASTLGGAGLHFVGYDEPPPREHRDECMTRLLDYGGYEMFAMTPLKTNTGWIRRDIFKQREAPHITVVRGSMHDNPTLDEETKRVTLGSYQSDVWRKAREFGDFVDVGGLIYPDFERCVLKTPPPLELIRSWDVVVGIDPGIRNCGIVWVGFDRNLTAWVFNEALLQDKTADDYAALIKAENNRMGIKDVSFVTDPAAKQRAQANGMTVLSELVNAGIYPNLGQNDHELGFGQMRSRMQHGRFFVSPTCVGLRAEADDYASKDPGEGKDDSHLDPVKGRDHRLDALRYAVLERFWDKPAEDEAPRQNLGFQPGRALPASVLHPQQPVGPLGSMS